MALALMPARSISKNDVLKMQKRISGLQSKAKNAVEKVDRVLETVVTAAETTGTAFGLAVYEGKYGPLDVQGVPISLLAGAGAHLFALLTDGNMGSHAQAIGNGALAYYAVREGISLGTSMRDSDSGPGDVSGSGSGRVRGTDSLIDGERNPMSP
jgi:hypothetical protein